MSGACVRREAVNIGIEEVVHSSGRFVGFQQLGDESRLSRGRPGCSAGLLVSLHMYKQHWADG